MNTYNIFILTVFSLFLYIYWYLKKAYSFFDKYSVPHIKPKWIFSNITGALIAFKRPMSSLQLDLYRLLDSYKFVGIFSVTKPMIVVRDVELIKNILVKDFAHFQTRGIKVYPKAEPLANNIVNQTGEEWRNSRMKLTSTFTTGKMKMMLPLIRECGEKLKQILNNMPKDESFDAKELIARFNTDVIGTCAFGLNTNCLENPDSEFRKNTKKIFEFTYCKMLRLIWSSMPETLIKLLGVTNPPKSTEYFFKQIVDKTVQYRETNHVTRNDFLDLLIALKNGNLLEKYHDTEKDLEKFLSQTGSKREKKFQMSADQLAAQSFLFFAAGFEPTSVTLSFLLLELAQNPQIQDKVRDEINTVLHNNDEQLTYDVMKQMTYTDMVIAETFRKYPIVVALVRECTQNYKIPDTDAVIAKGVVVLIPTIGMQYDKKYFENPDQFYPEHFTEEAKSKRPHYAYLPFGEGPRMCIAERFAKMQIKLGLIYMLRNFAYRTSPKMKFPIEYEKTVGILQIKGGVWLKCEKV